MDTYGNMTIPAGVEGYLILRGKVTSANQQSRLNRACIYLNNAEVECDDAIYTIDEGKNIIINKTADRFEVNIGDEVTFTLRVTNNGKSPISNFTVVDTLPAGLTYVNGSATSNGFASFVPSGRTLTWSNYSSTLAVGASITLTFRVTVDVEGTHTNGACVSHSEVPENCDHESVKAKDPLYCLPPEMNKSTYESNSKGKATARVTCSSHNGKNAVIEIVCGNGEVLRSDGSSSSFTSTCNYDI